MSAIDLIIDEIGEAYATYLLRKALDEQGRGFDVVEDDGSPGFVSSYDDSDNDYYCDDYEDPCSRW